MMGLPDVLEAGTIHINPTFKFTMLPFSGAKATIPREPRPVMKATSAEFVLPKNAIATRTTAFDSFDMNGRMPPVTTF